MVPCQFKRIVAVATHGENGNNSGFLLNALCLCGCDFDGGKDFLSLDKEIRRRIFQIFLLEKG